MTNLVIAEHDDAELKPATLNVLAAAEAIGGDTHVLVAGDGCASVADAAANAAGVAKTLLADHPAYGHGMAENTAALIAELASGYSHILAASSTTGKSIIPRLAALLDVAAVSDVMAVLGDDTFKRPTYAGNVIATVRCAEPIKVMTIRGTGFDPVAGDGGSASVEAVTTVCDLGLASFVSEELSVSERPELTAAEIVVSGGRGFGSQENFAMIERLADKLGAAIGASRAAVDAGYAPNDMQVGQTGKIVAPQLYIAVAISGAIQHLAGMKDSKVIVAINKDEDAPIFQVADYGLVADLFEALPELEQLL